MPVRNGDTIDVHQLPACALYSRKQSNHFLMTVAAHGALREKIAQAERMTGKQTMVTAKLFGARNKRTDVTTDNEIKHSEKIQNEKRRLAGYVE